MRRSAACRPAREEAILDALPGPLLRCLESIAGGTPTEWCTCGSSARTPTTTRSTQRRFNMSSKIRAIRSEADYDAALARIDVLMDAKADTPEGDELDVLK